MKMNKKFLYSLVIVLVLAVMTCGIVYATSVAKGKEIGQQVAEINSKGSEDLIATVNGEEISQKSFDKYKVVLNQNNEYSDKEILNKMIEKRVLEDKAISEGFIVSVEEVNAAVTQVKTALQQDEEQYKFLKEYLSGLGISEEQYWSEIVPEEYKQVLTVNKMYKSLRDEFIKNNNLTNPDEIKSKFDIYWDEYKNDLISKADVQANIK